MSSNPHQNGPRPSPSPRPPLSSPNGNGSSRYPRATPVEDDDDAAFRVTPDALESSSILGELTHGPLSAIHSDVSNSRVDLLAHLRPKNESSAGLSRTESIRTAAPPTIPIEDDCVHFDVTHATDDESSAVDLGSRHEIEVSFLGDSQASTGSAVLDTMPRRASSSVHLSGSAAGSFQSAASGLAVEARPWAISWQENKQAVAWGGGALIGLAASVVLFGGLAAGGVIHFGNNDAAHANPRFAAELRHSGLRTNELQNRAQDFQSEASTARRQAADARALLEQATRELQLSRSEHEKLAAETKSLRDQVASATAKLEQGRNESRAALERALADSETRLAKLSADQAERLQTVEKAAADRVRAEAAATLAARRALDDFRSVVNRKLSDANLAPVNARPEELLAAVDNALSRRSKDPVADSPNADRLLNNGLRAYRDRDFALAERSLAAAAKANANDARIRYLLGLARNHLGRSDDAQSDFFVAAALERKYQPSPRDVDEILIRLTVADRGVVGQYRP